MNNKLCKPICIYIQSHNILNKQSYNDFYYAIVLSNIYAIFVDLKYMSHFKMEKFCMCIWVMQEGLDNFPRYPVLPNLDIIGKHYSKKVKIKIVEMYV